MPSDAVTDSPNPRKAGDETNPAKSLGERPPSGSSALLLWGSGLFTRFTAWFNWRGPPRAAHLRVGDRAERIAAKMLRGKGYRLLARNVRTSGGEADLVMLATDRRTVVLVEVKGRINSAVGAAVAINAQKRSRLVRTLDALRREHGWADRPCRIDVVTVEWQFAGKPPVIRHYENAVTARG